MPPDASRGADPLLDSASLQRFLRTHHLPPLDRFGQHFLVDHAVLEDIVEASDSDPEVPLIEIGAGLGILTRALAATRQQAAARSGRAVAPLIAVERDQRLIPLLRKRVEEFPGVRVLHADILTFDPARLLATFDDSPTPYDVIGNIPYNITAPILQKFLAHHPRPRSLTFLLDDAVAEVLAARPPELSLRALSAQVYAEPIIVRPRIPPSAFVPPPAVHSAIVRLVVRASPLVPPAEEQGFFRLVRAGFSQKRKILANALAASYRLQPAEAASRLRRAHIDPKRRAETLSIPDWRRLLRTWENLTLSKQGNSGVH